MVQLNQRQTEALLHKQGPMMVLAGPGSGKTTVITHRIKYLIDQCNVDPNKILVITFTKAAAEEMKTRFKHLSNVHLANSVSFGTFHSFFFRIIRNKMRYTVNDVLKEYEKQELLKQIIHDTGLEEDEDFLQMLTNEISLIKNELLSITYYNAMCCGSDDFKAIFNKYENYKTRYHKIDFDDMLTKCYELITTNENELIQWRNRYEYILIDEFQDINKVQYECIKLLAKPKNNLFIVGDDDQSIYKFRGARPEFLLQFTNDMENVKKTILNINYRSTDNIISICNKVIINNQQRYQKNIEGTNKQGTEPILLRTKDINDEAAIIANKIKILEKTMSLDEIAVIYRTNVQVRAFVDSFMDLNIPFQIKDEVQTIYDHFISLDICAYLKLAVDRNNDDALERIINKPKRYMKKTLISSAKRQSGGLLHNILVNSNLAVWQLAKIEELMFYLNAIKKRQPYDAFKYIRKAVGYDGYLHEYADFRRTNPKGLFEVLEELQEGSKAYQTIEEYLTHIDNVVLKLKNNKDFQHKKGVVLSTMHSAKGLEFDTVFLPSIVDGVIPHEKSKTEHEIEEERRLLYVAMTRAKQSMYLSLIKTRYEKDVETTRFLKNIII